MVEGDDQLEVVEGEREKEGVALVGHLVTVTRIWLVSGPVAGGDGDQDLLGLGQEK
jgi:hypothetical protein